MAALSLMLLRDIERSAREVSAQHAMLWLQIDAIEQRLKILHRQREAA